MAGKRNDPKTFRRVERCRTHQSRLETKHFIHCSSGDLNRVRRVTGAKLVLNPVENLPLVGQGKPIRAGGKLWIIYIRGEKMSEEKSNFRTMVVEYEIKRAKAEIISQAKNMMETLKELQDKMEQTMDDPTSHGNVNGMGEIQNAAVLNTLVGNLRGVVFAYNELMFE